MAPKSDMITWCLCFLEICSTIPTTLRFCILYNMFITLPVQCIFLRAHNELICQIMEPEKGTLVIHSWSNVVRQVHMTVYNATSACDVHFVTCQHDNYCMNSLY